MNTQTLDVNYPHIRALFTESGIQAVDAVIETVAAICERYTRGQIIDALQDNDPNGCYSDDLAICDFGRALTDTEIAISVAFFTDLFEG